MRVVLPAAITTIIVSPMARLMASKNAPTRPGNAAGVAANMTVNPLESVTTVTVQIVMLLTGDNEFDSVKTLSAFALGITLFVITLLLNVAALTASRRLGQRYE